MKFKNSFLNSPAEQMRAGKEIEAEQHAMYIAFAEALDLWAVIEGHLCSIFAVAVGAQKYEPAAAAFSAILSFEAQIDMVHAAIAQSFAADSETYKEWVAIKKKLDKARPVRNKLAHGKILLVAIEDGGLEYRFLPFYHLYTHKEREEFVHMTTADLKTIASQFRDSIKSLYEFGKKIGARQKAKPGKLLKATKP
jgi:hypothetical protein